VGRLHGVVGQPCAVLNAASQLAAYHPAPLKAASPHLLTPPDATPPNLSSPQLPEGRLPPLALAPPCAASPMRQPLPPAGALCFVLSFRFSRHLPLTVRHFHPRREVPLLGSAGCPRRPRHDLRFPADACEPNPEPKQDQLTRAPSFLASHLGRASNSSFSHSVALRLSNARHNPRRASADDSYLARPSRPPAG